MPIEEIEDLKRRVEMLEKQVAKLVFFLELQKQKIDVKKMSF
jgi:hypothetical protein